MPRIGVIVSQVKNKQSNVIGGQTDESKSSNLFDDNALPDA